MYDYIALQHGSRCGGMANPKHTLLGRMEVASVGEVVKEFEPRSVVMGEGERFEEIYDVLKAFGYLGDLPMIFCAMLGTASCRHDASLAILPNKIHHAQIYYGPVFDDSSLMDIWAIMARIFPPKSLLCCGRPFMRALIKQSLRAKVKDGHASLFGICLEEKRVDWLIQGQVFTTCRFINRQKKLKSRLL